MYFIVYLIEQNENRIVPNRWIRGFNEISERFINMNGINSNYDFETFWTDHQNAFDQNVLPNPDYVPNLTFNTLI